MKSTTMDTSNEYIKYYISVNENSQSQSGNYTNLTVKVFIWRTNTGYTTSGSGKVYCKINGTTYSQSITNSQAITHSGLTVFSKTLNIKHDSDGDKKLKVSAWFSHSRFTSTEQSYTFTLTHITRAAVVSRADGSLSEIGSDMTFNIVTSNSEYDNTITYTFGSQSGTLLEHSKDTAATLAIPMGFADEIPDTTSGTLTLMCTTYNGDDVVGEAETTYSVTLPESVKPVIDSVTLSGQSDYGFVKGWSKVTVTTVSTMAYSATKAKTVVTVNGETLSGDAVTSQLLKDAGDYTVTVTVTDSRGRSATTTTTFTVLDYEVPSFEVTVDRCDANGDWYVGGDYAKISGNCKIYDLSGEGGTLTVTNGTDTVTTDVDSGGTVSVIIPCDTDVQVTISMTLDDHISTSTKTVQVESTVSYMDYGEDGQSITFGAINKKQGQDTFAIDVEFEKAVYVNNQKLFYGVGDEVEEETGQMAHGFISNACKQLQLFIPTVPIMSPYVWFDYLKLCVRLGTGGYPYIYDPVAKDYRGLLPDFDSGAVITDGKYDADIITAMSVYAMGCGIQVNIQFSNAITSNTSGTAVTNNQCVSVIAAYKFTVYENRLSPVSSAASSSGTSEDTEANYKVTADLNVRRGAGTSYESLGKLTSGTVVTVYSISNGWGKIQYSNVTGYIFMKYTESTSDTAETGTVYTVTASSGLNVRSGPGTSYDSLGKLASGSEVTVYSVTDGWGKIIYNGSDGYINMSYVKAS